MIVLKAGPLERIPWLYHGFFTRYGGVSKAPYDSLNLSYLVGDDNSSVNVNWEKVKNYLPFKEIHLLRQIHSDRVVLTDTFFGKSPLWIDEGDALITSLSGLGVGVLTADCAPVILVNLRKKVVAVVHSGWRGTVRKIAVKALTQIARENELPDVMVAIGPAISGERYVVGWEVIEEFEKIGIDSRGIAWKDPSGKFHFDLQKAIERELLIAGVPEKNIVILPCCTYSDRAFFSYRQDKKCGRNLTVAGIIEKSVNYLQI